MGWPEADKQCVGCGGEYGCGRGVCEPPPPHINGGVGRRGCAPSKQCECIVSCLVPSIATLQTLAYHIFVQSSVARAKCCIGSFLLAVVHHLGQIAGLIYSEASAESEVICRESSAIPPTGSFYPPHLNARFRNFRL